MLFNEKDPEKEKMEKFAASCKPLEELLDSVRNIEGFPIGKDEDILALSDAPWYTACPNPYIKDFIEAFGKPYDEDTDTYERTPFVSDVSEGKSDKVYMAHTYHTKVPHKAIMPFVEHYTKEGDIIFDGFCGTGMSGIAAQLLHRRAILCDLSPAAAFIAYNYNTPVDILNFKKEVSRILAEVENECGWMYETFDNDRKKNGKINYIIWSDILVCPYCKNEYVFWDAAIDKDSLEHKKEYCCLHCNSKLNKKECERSTFSFFDSSINEEIIQTKKVPVLINYNIGKERLIKRPDSNDLNVIENILKREIPYWHPTNPMMGKGGNWGDMWRAGCHLGVTHVHHFYTKRNLWVISAILNKALKSKYNRQVIFLLTSFAVKTGSKLHNIGFKNGRINLAGALPNSMFIPSLIAERNILDLAREKIKDISYAFDFKKSKGNFLVTTGSSTTLNIKSCSIDYIFTDPPFGENLMYSEMNYIWESLLKVFTNNKEEAIINKTQNKSLMDYKELMTSCFKEMYRILKPNRWITVEFHNTDPFVWNSIQDGLAKAGFIVAQIAVLDKQQGSYNQMVAPGSAEKDLVINAYKPKKEFEDSFLKTAGKNFEFKFIEEHLQHLPVEPNIGRNEKMLYSKMLAYYIQKGYEIRLTAKQFYDLLNEEFKLIDGYWFTDSQLSLYEEWKKCHGLNAIQEIFEKQRTLFISDEKSALIWLYNFLNTPKSYSDILTAYNPIITNTDDDIPKIKQLLETNFIFENGLYRRPLTDKEKSEKLEKNEKELLKTFDNILLQARSSSKKIKSIRKEAIKLGFTKAYQEKRFEDILAVAKKLDNDILENNSEINDFVEIARMKTGEF
ncbi:DNA methyltransferase [Methanosarcina sp.]|uniref:DNA methyltransferase n=1 Tax=Methanosarcina sp. TaxID=2213 RepID=UPI002BCA093D|nr:DNA methyltransferase [Methanosarcina sp.]HOW14993.1 DNA methyltransferase [Methanosarcina sp.]